ncbi:ATP-dependent DNA helicase [Clostridium tagluense]|uniref:ATP-dependent DNA helicase n=1 Tax=Clostridium tagluense TaxID=360422 RepID=UPI001CF17D4C|nr:AAA family ATPase [Clostridium tagluense]MCB2299873.1 ATP-dependent RecD-like DNA helicase [Clostridium tagluense]
MKKEIRDKKLEIKGSLIEEFKIDEEVADKLINDYGIDVIDVIIHKPYILCHYHIELKVVKDIIEKNSLNKNENHKNRDISAATIIHAIEYLTEVKGDIFIYVSELKKKILELVDFVINEELKEALELLETEYEIVRDRDNEGHECIYLIRMYNAEVELANHITYFVGENRKNTCDSNKISEFINGYDSADIKLNKLQKEAVEMALSNRLSVITGVAGGGKTTAINAIVGGFKYLNYENIQLVAFTGKAVQRLSSVTGMQGSTIHRLLGIGLENRNKVSGVKADVLIIDEAGTVGLEIFKMLFECLQNNNSNTKIVIVGDKFQLHSISPGNVLDGLLKSGIIPVVNLKDVVRQEKHSLIITTAHKILEGTEITGKKSGIWFKKNEFEFIETDSEKIKQQVSKKVDKLLSNGTSIYDIQVISPIKNGRSGVVELNREIADRLNSIQEREVYKFGILDSVILTKNILNVFNGQKGFIIWVESNLNRLELITVDFGSRVVTFKGNEIENIELAYVSTVHKMQGSEAKNVIVVIDKEHGRILNRELLYVAVTRGKDSVTIIGSKEAFNKAVNRVSRERHSLLAERLIGLRIAS